MTNYNSDSIRVLEGLEAVRLRPGMYISSTDSKGLHHLVWEIVDNSVDEHLAGRCDKITVTLKDDNLITIEDNGVGIPVAKHKQTGLSTLETVLTVLHAGGKFDNNAYETSGGLHGVGIAVVNALSNKLIAEVKRDGYTWVQTYEKGVPITKLEKGKKTNQTGTKISFIPDDTIFDKREFNENTIFKRLKETAYLNKNLEVIFKVDTKHKKETHVFENDEGLVSFVKELNGDNKLITEDIIYFEGKQDNVGIEIALAYNYTIKNETISFANNIKTYEHGTHVTGFRTALTRAVNDYIKNILNMKNESVLGVDTLEGLTSIISVKISDIAFEGQTKGKLTTADARSAVEVFTYDNLYKYLSSKPHTARAIVDKILQTKQVRIASKKAKEAARKIRKASTKERVEKLADCRTNILEDRELFIVEGDSAGGSAKMGRDSLNQAILPIKGKIKNVHGDTVSQALSNSEVSNLVASIGTGIGEKFDIDKLRYDKIILMSDADVDGYHINTLVLTFFYNFMPQLIRNGHIYIANAPLYRITHRDGSVYLFDDEEKDKYVEEMKGKKYKLVRFKGLGEMDADQLWDTTMNPDTRTLTQVDIEISNEGDTREVFEILMGNSAAKRRKFISENSDLVDIHA